MTLLPPSIQEIVRLVGFGKAMALVREFGGQEMPIPRTERGAAWAALVELIGEPATRTLTAAIPSGHEKIYIALCYRAMKADRNRRMIARYDELLAAGHSGRGAVSVIVREFGPISYRQVEAIVNSPLPPQEVAVAQGALF